MGRIAEQSAIPEAAYVATGTSVGIPATLPLRGLVQVWRPTGRSRQWAVESKPWYSPKWLPTRRFKSEAEAREYVRTLTGSVPGAWVIETY